MKPNDKTCLSYWFPILKSDGLPVPRTESSRFDCETVGRDLFKVFDGEPIGPAGERWLSGFRAQAESFGLPCFLRSGQTSHKHDWKNTCYLSDAGDLAKQVIAIIEFSEMQFVGPPWDVWVLRELLPTEPLCVLPYYGGMPLVPEVRCFIDDGAVKCWHPYWPRQCIIDGFPFEAGGPAFNESRQRVLPSDIEEIIRRCHDLAVDEFMPLAERVASVFQGDGAWSCDLLPTKRGWFVTDMALAGMSYHWEGCGNIFPDERFQKPEMGRNRSAGGIEVSGDRPT